MSEKIIPNIKTHNFPEKTFLEKYSDEGLKLISPHEDQYKMIYSWAYEMKQLKTFGIGPKSHEAIINYIKSLDADVPIILETE